MRGERRGGCLHASAQTVDVTAHSWRSRSGSASLVCWEVLGSVDWWWEEFRGRVTGEIELPCACYILSRMQAVGAAAQTLLSSFAFSTLIFSAESEVRDGSPRGVLASLDYVVGVHWDGDCWRLLLNFLFGTQFKQPEVTFAVLEVEEAETT